MKVFWNACKQSVKLPQKKATFALNRIGMDVTVIYLFILLAIASIPSLIGELSANNHSVHIHPFFLLIYFFIFYYLVLVLIVFSALSVFAYIATILAKGLGRKLQFSIMWKMAAFAMTIPLLLFTVLSFIYPLSFIFVTLSIIYMLIVTLKIILIYPKMKK